MKDHRQHIFPTGTSDPLQPDNLTYHPIEMMDIP